MAYKVFGANVVTGTPNIRMLDTKKAPEVTEMANKKDFSDEDISFLFEKLDVALSDSRIGSKFVSLSWLF